VCALAPPVNHVRFGLDSGQGKTSVGVSVARTRPPNDHVGYGVVIFFLNVFPSVQKIIAQSVQLGEVDAQIGHFQEILDLLRVRVVDVESWG
jgi:hypothetical protein